MPFFFYCHRESHKYSLWNFAIKNNSIIFVAESTMKTMKYNELHKKLRKAGCVDTGSQMAGHPKWYSPITKRYFATSNHQSAEVAPGTLKNIRILSGVDL